MRRWRSQAHLRCGNGLVRPTSPSEWRQFLGEIEEQISRGTFKFNGLRWHKIGPRTALSSNHLEDVLVIRKISNNIRRCYGVRESNRSQLIRTAKQALAESVPKTILRIDIKSCYESIDRNKLLNKIQSDSLVSSETVSLAKQLFREATARSKAHRSQGIPRGLILSTTLAELALRDLDKKLRALPGTYLLLRYVDDILIFTTADREHATASVRELLAELGLKINESKFSAVRVGCNCEIQCTHGHTCPCAKGCLCIDNPHARCEFDFLGYKLSFSPHNTKDPKKLNAISCTFSTRKISRIKHRVWVAFYAFDVDHDWELLMDRIRYLADNQKLESQPSRRGLLAGLSYTHAECDPGDPTVETSLSRLDQFYRAKLRAIKQLIPPIAYERLARLSFQSGFAHHRRTDFSGSRVLQIKKCWAR
ncbi:antiviral reverse transcriptase Drt3a [Frateuria flava]